MSSKELIYDKEELEATIKIAKKIIKSLESSIKVLENPEDNTPCDVHQDYVFVSATIRSLSHNMVLIRMGAAHGMASMVKGFSDDLTRENFELDALPIYE